LFVICTFILCIYNVQRRAIIHLHFFLKMNGMNLFII